MVKENKENKENQFEYYFNLNEIKCFYKKHILSNNQICQIIFCEYKWYFNKKIEYYVGFAVADKKKDLNNWFNGNKQSRIDHKTSGNCGLEALIWAKKQLIEFEEFIKEKYYDYNIKICIEADDSKRMRTYYYGLKDLNYKKINRHGIWILCKEIIKEAD